MITASRLELAEKCLYPFRKDIKIEHNKQPSEHAIKGTKIHNLIYHCLTHDGNMDQVELGTEEFRYFTVWYNAIGQDLLQLKKEGVGEYHAEISYGCSINDSGFNVRVLGTNINRDYANDVDFAGTADLVILKEDEAELYEWKTGQPQNTTRVQENWQMRSLAALVDKAHGPFKEIKLNLCFINEERCIIQRSSVQSFSHNHIFLPLMQKLKAQLQEEPKPQMGLHCVNKYCSAFAHCPAQIENMHLLDSDAVRWIHGS